MEVTLDQRGTNFKDSDAYWAELLAKRERETLDKRLFSWDFFFSS